MEKVSMISLWTTESSTPMTDYDDDSLETVKSPLDIFPMVVYSVTFFLGLTGNGLVFWVAGFHMPHTINVVWYLNLAVAGFTIILSLPLRLILVALHNHWPFGQLLCKLNSTKSILHLLSSVFL